MDKELSKKNTYIDGLLSYVFIIFCSFIMSLNSFSSPFRPGSSATDSSVFQYVARVIIRGGMPYRDTFDHKGPLIYLIDALGLIINSQIGIWLIELVFIFIIFLFTFKIARMIGSGYFSSCAVVAFGVLILSYYYEGGNLTEEYACAFIIISLYFFLKYFLTGNIIIPESVFCGMSFAAVCLLRINMASLWVVMCIGVLINSIRNKKYKDIVWFLLWFILGAAILIIPVVSWLMINNAFYPFIEDYFVFNSMYSTDVERASLKNILFSIIHFGTDSVSKIIFPVLVFFCISEKKMTDILCIITAAFSILCMSISGQLYGHYGMILYPIAVYSIGRLFFEIWENRKAIANSKLIAMYMSAVVVILLLFGSTSFELLRTVRTSILGRYHLPDGNKTISQIVIENTEPEDRITVCGNNDIIYLLSNRESVSKYSYQSPIALINPDIYSEYLKDIDTLRPKVIIIENDSFLYSDIVGIMGNDYSLLSNYLTTEIFLRDK